MWGRMASCAGLATPLFVDRQAPRAIYRVVELESCVAVLLTTLPCFFLDLVAVFEESAVVTPLASVLLVELEESVAVLLP